MTLLTAKELKRAREDMLDLLPDTAVIQRPTSARDGYGYIAPTWAASGTVTARIDPLTGRQAVRVIPQMEEGRNYYMVTLPHDADIRDGDRLFIGGDHYQVTTLHDDHSLRLVRRAIVSKVG